MKRFLVNCLSGLWKYVFPTYCLGCNNRINNEKNELCILCRNKIIYTSEDSCCFCGDKLEKKQEKNCIKCSFFLKGIEWQIFSVTKYEDLIKNIIIDFKHKDKTYLANFLGKMIIKKYFSILKEIDIISCIPINKRKLILKKYNHSALIAQKVAKKFCKKIFIPDLLIKTRNTISQQKLKLEQRRINLKGSIILNKEYNEIIVNKKILLIDDVCTSGYTMKECFISLANKKIQRVYGITISKKEI